MARVVADRQAGAGDIGGIVAKAITLRHARHDSLSGGEVGLDPPNGERAEE
jgi:hypothetical protein